MVGERKDTPVGCGWCGVCGVSSSRLSPHPVDAPLVCSVCPLCLARASHQPTCVRRLASVLLLSTECMSWCARARVVGTVRVCRGVGCCVWRVDVSCGHPREVLPSPTLLNDRRRRWAAANELGPDGVRALAEALKVNTTLMTIWLDCGYRALLGSVGVYGRREKGHPCRVWVVWGMWCEFLPTLSTPRRCASRVLSVPPVSRPRLPPTHMRATAG
mmetsp:Transcript_53065/g.124013  ORF Transcript_53065/g.124013 Transcript_53065/m.124013 type:complete len:216 (-) Transcript_53065:220-867(-)